MTLSAELLKDNEFLKYVAKKMTPEQRERFMPLLRQEIAAIKTSDDYEPWLQKYFPAYCTAPLAPHHHEMWKWQGKLRSGKAQDALIACINRGGAKSTTIELMTTKSAAEGKRKYCLYLCRRQDQADDHVGNVATMIESPQFGEDYPDVASKKFGKFGDSKGWRRNRIRTASGFTIDALGLDVASRGVKLDFQRPDLIVLDDIDKHDDSPRMTDKIIYQITQSILPSGADDCAVIFVQNMIHANSMMAQIHKGTADFLRGSTVINPVPALTDFAYEPYIDEDQKLRYRITSGVPTWAGYSLDRCERDLNKFGVRAFKRECQHEVDNIEGAFWSAPQIDSMRCTQPDRFMRIGVGVDPSGGDGEHNDEQGIVVVGYGYDKICYILADYSCKETPSGWGMKALQAYNDFKADFIVVEKNFGGDMAIEVIESLDRRAKVIDVTASRGKDARTEPIAALCGDKNDSTTWDKSRVKICGSLPKLETEMTMWHKYAGWSPNRLDAAVWVITELIGGSMMTF